MYSIRQSEKYCLQLNSEYLNGNSTCLSAKSLNKIKIAYQNWENKGPWKP